MKAVHNMKQAFLKAPFLVEIRDVELNAPGADEVLLDIKACGVCGSDVNAAQASAAYHPFGHELAGIVEAVGSHVTNVHVGDRVAMESSSYCGDCPACRNGHVELCDHKYVPPYEGFAEKIVVNARALVPIRSLSFEEGAIIEPFGVAMDLVEVADIQLGDEVVVYGAGPIALLAVRLARLKGAGHITVLAHAHSQKRIELAYDYGADEVLFTDQVSVPEVLKGRNIQRVLVTTPPSTVPEAVSIASFGGVISVIGIAKTPEESKCTLDINYMHFHRLQLRFSHATPALFFPLCIDLIERGLVDVGKLITHRFALEDMQQAMSAVRDDKQTVGKVLMVRE